MTFQSMLDRIRILLRDEEEPYEQTTEMITMWLQGAYLDIQMQSEFWEFLHQRGQLFVTAAGMANYDLGNVKSLLGSSLYYTGAGSTARQPLCLKDYSCWVAEQAAGVLTAGPPRWLIELPDNKWKVDPVPDGIYTVYGDATLRPATFTDLAEEPLWEEEYHELVALSAMRVAATSALRPDSPEARALAAYSAAYLPAVKMAFQQRYLPGFHRAGSHL